VNKANVITVFQESDIGIDGIQIVIGFIAVGVNHPVIVSVLVVVTRHLLLLTSLREELDVRMKQASSVAGVLDRDAGAIGDFKGRIREFGATEIGLEEGGHLGVTGTRVLEDEEMEPEIEHVDEQGDEYQAEDPCWPVSCINNLQH
jgi:hypothetical protein